MLEKNRYVNLRRDSKKKESEKLTNHKFTIIALEMGAASEAAPKTKWQGEMAGRMALEVNY